MSTAASQLTAHNSRVVSVRLTDEQFRHVVAQAGFAGTSLAAAFRAAMERDIDATPDIGHEDGSPGRSMGYRDFLAIADFTAALEELQAQDAD